MRTMKKALCILTAAAMTALLYGCAQETANMPEVVVAVTAAEKQLPEVTEVYAAETRETEVPAEETQAPIEETQALEELPAQTEPQEQLREKEEETPAKPAKPAPEPVKTHVHDWQHRVTAPTCTERGYTDHTCGICGSSYRDSYVNAAGHAWGQWTVENASGCTRRSCSVCGEQETDRTAHIHQFTVHYTKEPCCKEEGYTQYLCTGCKATYIGDYTQKLPHNYTATVVAPTAYSQGYTQYLCREFCGNKHYHKDGNSFCDAMYTADYTAALTADSGACRHDFIEITVCAPTCYSEGVQKFLCEACGFFYTETVPRYTGHEWVINEAFTVGPTCAENGAEGYWCIHCRLQKPDDIIPALGHDYIATVVAATEQDRGYTEFTCSVCGDSFRDHYTEVTGGSTVSHTHSYRADVTEPKCSDWGYTTYTCDCGHSYVGNYLAAAGCRNTDTVVAPTETSRGYTEHTCTVCGNSYRDNWTDPTAPEKPEEEVHIHSYTVTVTEPTCKEDGYTIHSCTCGDSYRDTWVDAIGHNWSSWEVEKEATESEAGYRYRSCTVCSIGVGEEIPVLPHSHNFAVTVDYREATCRSEGYCTRACACGETSTEILTAEHNWVQCSEPEVGHYDVRIVCHCGWSCSAEGNYIAAFADHVAGIDKETRYDHSYYDTAQWVVDVPARYWVACGTCGAQQ